MSTQLPQATSVMSWAFIQSAIRRVQAESTEIESIDLNLESPSTIILCGTSIEAFANEMSSVSAAFLKDRRRDVSTRYATEVDALAQGNVTVDLLESASSLRMDATGSFYERYKRLLGAFQIEPPPFLDQLKQLHQFRNALVHYRACDVPIIDDENGVFRHGQQPPNVLSQLGGYRVRGWPIVAAAPGDQGLEWPLRISTNAMAAWALSLTLDAITYVLDNLPEGAFRDFAWRRYKASDATHVNVFEKGIADVGAWKAQCFHTSSS